MIGLTDGIDVDVLASSGSTPSPDMPSVRPGDDLAFRRDYTGKLLSTGDQVNHILYGPKFPCKVIGFSDTMVKVYFAGATEGKYGAHKGTDLLLVGRSQSHGSQKPTEAKTLCS
jgi:hypothetical protein